MKSTSFSITLLIVVSFITGCNTKENGKIIKIENMESAFVDPRNIEIWLPASYDTEPDSKYAVLYMHDGQNLFRSNNAYGGNEWQVDEWITRLSKEGKIRETLVVGIWNTPKRFREYMPSKPFEKLPEEIQNSLIQEYNGKPLGDEYLKFLVKELKPYIDKNFRTLPGQKNTFIMGSSMGGLISSYALCEYPEIFHGAGCMSTHWPLSLQFNNLITSKVYAEYFTYHLPSYEKHSIYFDYGTKTLDGIYEPHQKIIDNTMMMKGYTHDRNWITLKFEGAEHNEKSWSNRLNAPLQFLLSH